MDQRRNQRCHSDPEKRLKEHAAFIGSATGNENSDRKGEQDCDQEADREGEHLLAPNAAHEQGKRKNRDGGEQVVNRADGPGKEFAQDNIESIERGEKEKAKRAFAAFLAQAIAGVADACKYALKEDENRQGMQERGAKLGGRTLIEKSKRKECRQRNGSAGHARPVGAGAASGDREFTLDDRQKSHGFEIRQDRCTSRFGKERSKKGHFSQVAPIFCERA